MWHTWTTLLLVSCALVEAAEVEVGPGAGVEVVTESPVPVATTRAPPRTLDRLAAELAWKSWLQSPESGNQNAPARRITTKSLFITPLVCPKGQRLDRNGCVQVVTVNKDEHERILLEQLNALFTSAPSGDVLYDYGEDEPGPLQLSIPIGLDPQAAPLQGQESVLSAQAQDLQPSYVKVDKKDQDKPAGDAGIEAELELLKLQHNNTALTDHAANYNALHSHVDKPKRDSTAVDVSDTEAINTSTEDVGQKELVFGHVNVDPVSYMTNVDKLESDNIQNEKPIASPDTQNISATNAADKVMNGSFVNSTNANENKESTQVLKKDGDKTKLNPENDYSDIGEAIKLISRYAEVTTDDNFAKDQKKLATKEDSILGTRTKLQHRRNRPKLSDIVDPSPLHVPPELVNKDMHNAYPKNGAVYRYPWPGQNTQTPPPNYPFRHLQDYWPGRNKVGGVYNTHENPRRHHHSYPHNFRPHGYPYLGPGSPDAYPEQLKGYIHRMAQHHANSMRSHTNNQDLYSLLGLRHWFSSEGTSKR